MEESAKDTLLKYLTNSITDSPINDNLTVEDNVNISMGDLGTDNFTVDKVMGVLPAKDIINDIDLLLYYGYGTKTSNNHTIGFIAYCDKENNVLQVVNTFSSGSEMFCIYDLKINEENKMYAIGYDAQEADGVVHTRLLLFENIAQYNQLTNQYEVKLRTSYRLQGNYNDNAGSGVDANYTRVLKDNTSASYLIYYRYINLMRMLRFKIVFGGTNEWEDYTTSINYARSTLSVEWSQEVPYITILNRDSILQEQINKYYITSPSSITTSNIDFTTAIQDLVGASFTTMSSRIAMVNSAYAFVNFAVNTPAQSGQEVVNILSYRLDYSNNQITNTLNKNAFITYEGEAPDTFDVYVNNNTQVIVISCLDYQSANYGMRIYISNYSKGYEVYYASQISYTVANYNFFPIMYNVYNMAYITLMVRNISDGNCYADNFKFMYAEDTYSGQPYINKNSLLADKVSLYDGNNSLIFNRDVSNISVQANSVTSSVNIPNIYLNNATIEKEDLLSKNNNIIVSDNTSIQKNIYEDLYINFINRITMQDQNTDNYVFNQSGANRIVDSAFYRTDYSEAGMTKYRINYSDNTSYIGTISSSQITSTTKQATYGFAIYVSKQADTLELISNDENTTYQTIDISNLSVGLYSISQHVYIQ